MDKQPMTRAGKSKLDEELRKLLQVERPSVIKAIEEARNHGDLSENADYDAAKERQAFIESRISEIQGKLASAEIIDPKDIESETVVFGATVTLLDLEVDKKTTYQIVGVDEADIKEGKISIFSPLGRAVIGKRVDEVVEFHSPKGDKEYKVVNFKFQ